MVEANGSHSPSGTLGKVISTSTPARCFRGGTSIRVVDIGPLGSSYRTLQQWVGSSGWLRKIEYSNRRYAVLGEPMTGRGRITRLFQDGDRHIAELEVWAEKRALDGEVAVTAPGTAEVVLPTRERPIEIPG